MTTLGLDYLRPEPTYHLRPVTVHSMWWSVDALKALLCIKQTAPRLPLSSRKLLRWLQDQI